MSISFKNEDIIPYTFEDNVADNLEIIRDCSKNGVERALSTSTSQQIMVAFALCRGDMLEECKYSDRKIAWRRLDNAQREAIKQWYDELLQE
jgi:hypothetical protein